MSRYIKSSTDTQKLNENLQDLKEQMQLQRHATRVNNRELQKLNTYAQSVHEEKIDKLEAELRQIKEDQKWVKGEKPALDLNPDHLMKKLNVI